MSDGMENVYKYTSEFIDAKFQAPARAEKNTGLVVDQD